MGSPVVFVLILATIAFETAPTYSQTIHPSQDPLPVGSNVTLFSTATVSLGGWLFNNSFIVFTYPGGVQISDTWKDRVTYNQTTSSLTIGSLQVEDSGLYTLEALNMFRAELTLSVQVPISNVTLRTNSNNLVEFNDTAVLMCSASTGSSLSYIWLKNGSEVTAGGQVQFSNGGATLTIVSVTRYDEGSFRCNVSNGISYGISPPVYLNINYGPSNTTMMITPLKNVYRTGSNITLSCSTESSPAAMIRWMFDGMNLLESAPELQLKRVTESNSGSYQCIFHNTVTSRFSSASSTIRIFAPIAAVKVDHTGGPAILHEPFTMHCEVNGSVDKIQWWRKGQPISADNTTVFDMANKTLTLNPVQLSDNGEYQCQAFNAVSNMTSRPYTVEVNYGPMKPVITGPSMGLAGTKVLLNCSSASHPPSHFSWHFNGSRIALTSELMIGPLTSAMSGKYICMAYNNVTGKNSTAYTMLTVLAPVTMASIKIVGHQPILNHTFTLTCETAGDVESIIWMYGWSPLYPDNTRNLSMDNATLTFDPVMMSDNGDYRCEASNPLSNFTSKAFMLDVFYGPEMPSIMGPKVAKIGDNVTLSCKASSNPPSIYKWFFNYSLVANTSEYVTSPLTKDMSGMYTCKAYNKITGKNSTAYTMLTVLAPVTMASIKIAGPQPIMNHTFTLNCETAGDVESIIWMYGWSPLYPDNTRNLSMDNTTLTFDPVMMSDNGDYRCEASNPLSSFTSKAFMLDVFYGPEMPSIMGPKVAKIGDNVTLSCKASSNPPSIYKWFFNDSLVANTSEYVTSPLTKDMSGMYTCKAYNKITGKNSTAYTMLTVVEPIMDVRVEAPMNPPIEGYLYELTCNMTGSAEHIYWMKNGEPLHENNRTVLKMDNKKVIFSPLEYSDTGNYSCMAVNPVCNMTSPSYKLIVNFGPETPIIDGPAFAEIGHTATFYCSAKSMPPSHFSWWFNGSKVDNANASVFTTGPLSFSMSGYYSCMAHNSVTRKNSTSSKMLKVIEAIKSVMVRNNTVPINYENFTLTCNITGPYDSIYWMKDNMHLNTSTANMSYHTEKNMLHFTPVTLYNDGEYQCVATNQAGSHKSPPYMLLVNYGPLNVSIHGPVSPEFGFYVTLTCYADSRPGCDFYWFHQSGNSSVALKTGSVINFPAVEQTEGTYICKARNPVTNITMYQTRVVTFSHASALHIPSQGGVMMVGLFAFALTVLFN